MTTKITAENLSPITYSQIPVVTTELLAQLYGTEILNIQVNHTRNKDRFVEGKHYFKATGNELKNLRLTLSKSQSELQISTKTRSLILWTERGAARHAKMLETDQAWEVFEKLEDCYFSQKDAHPVCKKKSLPGKITPDQQEAIKQLVLTRGKSVPQEHQAKATITLWSALKSHFGCTYKEISEEQFTEALSLAARVPLEGELITRQHELPQPTLTISYPADWFIRRTPYIALRQGNHRQFCLDAEMLMECPSPALGVFRDLHECGYDVTAAEMEVRALRHIMEHTRHILGDIAMMAEKNRRAGLTFRV